MDVKVGDKVSAEVTDVCKASGSVKVGSGTWLWPNEYEPVAVADSNGKQPKFKVGDKVRALDSCGGGGFVAGDVYTVSRVYEDYSGPRISVEVDSVGSETNGWGAWHFEPVDAPLTIREGAFYRTRDGRKVGPMNPWTSALGWQWESEGYLWKDDGENYDKDSEHTIVAEWQDEPVAAVTSSNADIFDELEDWMADNPLPAPTPTTGFTVPQDAPEFGGGLKVGDRVNVIYCVPTDNPGTVEKIDGDSVTVRWDNPYDYIRSRFHIDELRLVAEATTAQEPVNRIPWMQQHEDTVTNSIADIVRRLEALEAKQPAEPKHCIGDRVTLSATVTGMNKRRVNVVIDGVPQPGGSLAVPPAALTAA